MSVEKWNLETVNEFINSKYENIELIDFYSKINKNGIRVKFVSISNGKRVRDMQLKNFLGRGCDFYEKTDKKITNETVSNYLKNKYPNLNIEVLKVSNEMTSKRNIVFKNKCLNIIEELIKE